MNSNEIWRPDWPDKLGLYWFYGWTEKEHQNLKYKPQLFMVEVIEDGKGFLLRRSRGYFISKEEAFGTWKPLEFVESPPTVQNDDGVWLIELPGLTLKEK